MRRLILSMSVSVDGFVARPDGSLDWFLGERRDPDHGGRRHRATLELAPGTDQGLDGRDRGLEAR